MERSVVLCADSESLRYPEIIGLDGEDLDGQEWLKTFSSASEARRFIQGNRVEIAWVMGGEDIDPVNSAAAFRKDMPIGEVVLVTDDASCSLHSRASRASIDAVVSSREFASRYAREKDRRRHSGGSASRIEQHKIPRVAVPVVAETKAVPFEQSAVIPPPVSSPTFVPAQVGMKTGSTTPFHVDYREYTVPQPSVQYSQPCVAMPSTRSQRAFILPVLSGSGGAGKSTVATLGALLARSKGYKTLLIDLDMQFGDLSMMLDVKDALSLDDAVDYREKIGQLKSRAEMPAFIAAPRRFERSEELARQLPELLDDLQGMFDLIIANTGGFWAEQHAVMLERSSKALFLVDQRPSSIRASRRVLELCAHCNIATNPLLFAVNRCSKNALYTSIDVSCALNGAPVVELRDGGRDVEEFVSSGNPLEVLRMQNELCTSLAEVLVDILPEREPSHSAELDDLLSQRRSKGLFRSARRRDAACLG